MSKTQRMINKMKFNVKKAKKSVWRVDCVGFLSVFNQFAKNLTITKYYSIKVCFFAQQIIFHKYNKIHLNFKFITNSF